MNQILRILASIFLAHPFCDHPLIPPKFARRRPYPFFASSIPPYLSSCPRRQSARARSASPAPQLVEPKLQLPAHAPWSILHQQWESNSLSLGMGANGLLVANPKAYPHLFMAGIGGSGKVRFGLQLLIAPHWRVAIYDRSGLDSLPFQQHPSAHAVLLDDQSHVIDYCALLCKMIRKRFVSLREAGVSTWGRLPSADPSAPPPAPGILTVIDEFANLANALPTSVRRKLWRGTRKIAAEGRKVWLNRYPPAR